MALLALHTSHSKHRAPAITAVRLAAKYREDQMPRSIGDFELHPEIPMQVGEVIAETPIGTRIPMALFPTIGINRPGTGRWPVLMKELDELAIWVRTQALPRLITGIEPSLPSLPTRYEIAIGHVDERSALSAGSAVSVAQLHNDRVPHTYEPEIVLSNFAVLEAMWDDARRFAGLDVPADDQTRR